MNPREARLRGATRIRRDGDIRKEFQHDRDRVLYSTAIRRLAGVTQVVDPSSGHVFHNRLTHSIKVAHVGRRLTEFILGHTDDAIIQKCGGLDADVVETSCLSHDLGHPPFGHNGEVALNDCLLKAGCTEGFEGNAQTFRIVTRLGVRKDGAGLNLTRATLNAILKYPFDRKTSVKKKKPKGKAPPKFGYYSTEAEHFDFARAGNEKLGQRQSLEAAVMDHADDVTYAVHDVDDFYRAGMIPLGALCNETSPEVAEFLSGKAVAGILDQHGLSKAAAAEILTTMLNHIVPNSLRTPYVGTTLQNRELDVLVSAFLGRWLNVVPSKPVGRQPPGITITTKHPHPSSGFFHLDNSLEIEIGLVKKVMAHYVFEHPSLVARQEGERHVIRCLFDSLYSATTDEDRLAVIPHPFQEQARDLFKAYKAKKDDAQARMRLVSDVIASLSDAQAVQLYKTFTHNS